MKIRALSKREVERDPYLVWNAFVNLLAMEEHSELGAEQRAAHLVFWYEHEVQNGGHFQYFENRGTQHLAETVAALGLLGASCQQQVLREAGNLWLGQSRLHPKTAEESCALAIEGEFQSLDARFHESRPPLDRCLETYLNQPESAFVVIR